MTRFVHRLYCDLKRFTGAGYLVIVCLMVLTVGSEAVDFAAKSTQQQGTIDVGGASDYFPFSIDEDHLSGAVDFSRLNHPLTAADRVYVCGSHFCTVGADLKEHTSDDKRIRFFGVNMVNLANFPNTSDAKRIANRLSRLGINLVRLHYIDHSTSHDPQDVKGVLLDGPFPTLNPVAVGRLRNFISVLSEAGIYVDLNLHVAYKYRADVDGVASGVVSEDSKPLYYFDQKMIDGNIAYARKLLEALQLKNKENLAMVEISNESSFVYSWLLATRSPDRWALDSVISGPYKDTLDKMWEKFSNGQPMPERTCTSKNCVAFLQFLSGLDHAYFVRLKKAIGDEIGDQVPVTGTQMIYGNLVEMDSQREMSYLDNHFYFDFYKSGSSGKLNSDWRIKNSSLIGYDGMSVLANLAFFRQSDKPYTISEFNQPWPNSYGSDMVPAITLLASLQDWDALIFYQYRDDLELDHQGPRWFNLSGDPSKLVSFGQLAWVFRTNAVTPARSTVDFKVTKSFRDSTILSGTAPQQVSSLFGEAFGANPLLPLIHRVTVTPVGGDPGKFTVGAVTGATTTSDTGEIHYSAADRLLTVSSPKVSGAFGFIRGSATIDLGRFKVTNATNSDAPTSILITCIAPTELASCTDFLVANPGGATGSVRQGGVNTPQLLERYSEEYPNELTFPSGVDGRLVQIAKPIFGVAPVFIHWRDVTITLREPAARVQAFGLDGAGRRLYELPVMSVSGNDIAAKIRLGGTERGSPWFEIKLE